MNLMSFANHPSEARLKKQHNKFFYCLRSIFSILRWCLEENAATRSERFGDALLIEPPHVKLIFPRPAEVGARPLQRAAQTGFW